MYEGDNEGKFKIIGNAKVNQNVDVRLADVQTDRKHQCIGQKFLRNLANEVGIYWSLLICKYNVREQDKSFDIEQQPFLRRSQLKQYTSSK